MKNNKMKEQTDSKKELKSMSDALLLKLDLMIKKEQTRYENAPLIEEVDEIDTGE